MVYQWNYVAVRNELYEIIRHRLQLVNSICAGDL